ncbi:MAG: YdeI/OmpD-associated family protein [Beutenbergiaceae bacterium]
MNQERPGRAGGTPERPAIFFTGPEEFRAWLEANHEQASELWMGLNAKHVPDRGLTWAQAVPEALCFGWIDSVSQRIDEDSRRQRWTPRTARSNWSAVNVAHVQRLLAQGRMHPAGIAAFERRAQSAGYSYEQGPAELTEAERAALAGRPAAQAFWDAATPGYRRTVAAWLHGAKREETRSNRLAELVAASAAGRLVRSQRYGTEPGWLKRAAQAAARSIGGGTPG